jgi:glycosyltransferase involved in cell wall biosynthesis
VIVHNDYARQQLLARRPGLNVAHIGQHFFLPEGVALGPDGDAPVRAESPTGRDGLREQLGLRGRFVVGTYGLLIPDKRLNVALRAFARFRRNHPQAVYLLVGPIAQEHDLTSLVQSLGLQDAVRMTGWQDPASFVRHMCVADLAVHLKYPHVGGTPYTPIRLLGLGVPTIISDIEPLAEIPADCCARVDPEGNEEEELLATLEYLATHEETRRQMAENGRRYIQAEHNPRKIAQEYQRFIEATLAGQPAGVSGGSLAASRSAPAGHLAPSSSRPEREWQQRLIEDVGAVLADWGVQADQEHLLRPIAEAIASLELGPQGGDA